MILSYLISLLFPPTAQDLDDSPPYSPAPLSPDSPRSPRPVAYSSDYAHLLDPLRTRTLSPALCRMLPLQVINDVSTTNTNQGSVRLRGVIGWRQRRGDGEGSTFIPTLFCAFARAVRVLSRSLFRRRGERAGERAEDVEI